MSSGALIPNGIWLGRQYFLPQHNFLVNIDAYFFERHNFHGNIAAESEFPSSSQCCQLSGVFFRTEMSSFPDFQLHYRIFFVRCLALSFDIPAAVGSKLEGKASRGGSTLPSLFWCPLYRIFYHSRVLFRGVGGHLPPLECLPPLERLLYIF